MIKVTLHQAAYDMRAFLRNRQAQFFTLALPVLFLVIFAALFGGHSVPVAGAGSAPRSITFPALSRSGSSRHASATW